MKKIIVLSILGIPAAILAAPLAPGDQPGSRVEVLVGITSGAGEEHHTYAPGIVLDTTGGIAENDTCAVTLDNPPFIRCVSGRMFIMPGTSSTRGTPGNLLYSNYIGSYLKSPAAAQAGGAVQTGLGSNEYIIYCDGLCLPR